MSDKTILDPCCGSRMMWFNRENPAVDFERDQWMPAALLTPAPQSDQQEGADARPDNCRNRLQSEGKAYPKSGCNSCGTGGITGCPHERKEQAQQVQGAVERRVIELECAVARYQDELWGVGKL